MSVIHLDTIILSYCYYLNRVEYLLVVNNMCFVCFQVITAAGAVKHEDIVQQAKELFKSLPTDPTTTNMLVAEQPAIFTGSEVCILL